MENYCIPRIDLRERDLSVSIGNNSVWGIEKPILYRWVNEDEFEVFYKNKWQTSDSIDYDFDVSTFETTKEYQLAKLLSETVQKMCDTLQHIIENEQISDNVHQWINNDLDYVQVNFFRTPPDGDYQHEVRTDTGISALDAINLLSVRIENTMNSII